MALLKFNNDAAQNAGVGTGASTSGAYCGILMAKAITANTGTKGIEFSIHGDCDVNYLTCYYVKKDGAEIRGGLNIINAIMGILRQNEINIVRGRINDEECDVIPELTNKPIGLVLQKILYTKNNQERSDGYKFDIVMPFNDRTRQTFKESQENAEAKSVDRILETLEDKDERIKNSGPQSTQNNDNYGITQDNATAQRPVSKFDQLNKQQGGYNQQQGANNNNQGGYRQQNSPDLQQNDDEFFN